MKKYTMWEVIKAFNNNEKLIFKCVTQRWEGNYVGIDDEETISFADNKEFENPFTCCLNMKMEWELVQQPVSFMVALNSRKRIKGIDWMKYHSAKELMNCLGTRGDDDIVISSLNGQWLIEEEEL